MIMGGFGLFCIGTPFVFGKVICSPESRSTSLDKNQLRHLHLHLHCICIFPTRSTILGSTSLSIYVSKYATALGIYVSEYDHAYHKHLRFKYHTALGIYVSEYDHACHDIHVVRFKYHTAAFGIHDSEYDHPSSTFQVLYDIFRYLRYRVRSCMSYSCTLQSILIQLSASMFQSMIIHVISIYKYNAIAFGIYV